MRWKDRKITYVAVIISILLHLVGMLLIFDLHLFAFSDVKEAEPPEPLELVFEQPTPAPEPSQQIPEKFYEIVENPNASEDQPEDTDMLSTANSRSRAPVILPGQIRAIPGSETEKQNQSQTAEREQEAEKLQEALEKSILAYKETRTFDRSALTGKAPSPQTEPAETESGERGESQLKPKGFDAELVGDFALSTYEWEWAPYWLEFKRKLHRVWYAPPAYYQLGLIHGHTIIRFKISRDGNIFEMEVLRQVGHSSLEHSSVSAIQAVFPFLPLPSSFPDAYLEVTLKMIYPNLREYQISGAAEETKK